jgi:hypothetical protein
VALSLSFAIHVVNVIYAALSSTSLSVGQRVIQDVVECHKNACEGAKERGRDGKLHVFWDQSRLGRTEGAAFQHFSIYFGKFLTTQNVNKQKFGLFLEPKFNNQFPALDNMPHTLPL